MYVCVCVCLSLSLSQYTHTSFERKKDPINIIITHHVHIVYKLVGTLSFVHEFCGTINLSASCFFNVDYVIAVLYQGCYVPLVFVNLDIILILN